MTDSTPRTRRRSWPLLAAIIAVLIVVGVGAFSLLSGRTSGTSVAIVNNDTGPAGDDLVSELTGSEAFDWTTGSDSRGSNADRIATVTIADGFSAALGSATTARPQQGKVSVEFSGASADTEQTLTALVDAANLRTSTTGIQGLLTKTAQAKAQLQQAVLPSQLLAGATNAADAQGQQLLGSVDQFLPFLQTASDGADQLVGAANEVSRLVDGARAPTAQLSGRLNELGLTIADVTTGADQLDTILSDVQNVLTANNIDAAPVAQTRSDLSLATSQLTSFSTLLGSTPSTNLGDAVQNGYDQLAAVSAQLSSAGAQLQSAVGPIAAGAPELLGGAKDQILAAITTLKTISSSVSQQLATGVPQIPAVAASQQGALATVLSEPIAVSYASSSTSTGFSADTIALVFGVVIVLLAAALAWTTIRIPRRPRS